VINRAQRYATQKKACRSTTQNRFRAPPDDLLLTEGGGGVQNGIFPMESPSLYVASIYFPESHHCLLFDKPLSPLDVTLHLFPKWSCPITTVSPSPLFDHGKSLIMTFTSNRQPPHHPSVSLSHHHLPSHPQVIHWPFITG
jgi:hypothetical protein